MSEFIFRRKTDTQLGNSQTDIHQRSGSVLITGSLGIGVIAPEATVHISGSDDALFKIGNLIESNIFFVSSSGKVGIGVSVFSDNDKLQIFGGNLNVKTDGTAVIKIDRGTVNNFALLKYKTDATESWSIGPRDDGTEDFHFFDDYGSLTTRLYLEKNTGRIGIGITSSLQDLLHVAGNISASNINVPPGGLVDGVDVSELAVSGGLWTRSLDGSITRDSNVQITGSQLMNGSIGIGIYPNALIHISGSAGALFRIEGSTGSEDLFVSSSGKIGIGTSTPTEKLHIYNGNLRVESTGTATIQFDRGAITNFALLQFFTGGVLKWSIGTRFDSTNNFHFFDDVGGNTSLFIEQTTGKVGIGLTNPRSQFDVSSSSHHGSNLSDRHIFTGSIEQTGSGDTSYFSDRVGIGIFNDLQSALHVLEDVSASNYNVPPGGLVDGVDVSELNLTASNHETRIDTLELFTGSLWTGSADGKITRESDVCITGGFCVTGDINPDGTVDGIDLQIFSSSAETRLTTLETVGDGGFWTASNGIIKRMSDVCITGSLYVTGDLIINDTASFQYIDVVFASFEHIEVASGSVVNNNGLLQLLQHTKDIVLNTSLPTVFLWEEQDIVDANYIHSLGDPGRIFLVVSGWYNVSYHLVGISDKGYTNPSAFLRLNGITDIDKTYTAIGVDSSDISVAMNYSGLVHFDSGSYVELVHKKVTCGGKFETRASSSLITMVLMRAD